MPKIAFVNQPADIFSVPPRGSIPIWIYEVARRLARHHDVIVYARRGHLQPRVEYGEGMQCRRIPIVRDCRSYRLLERWSESFKRPYVSSSYSLGYYYLDYALQVAKDLRAQQCDIVHLQSFSQFVPIIRALNPSTKIVLHMHCEWLTQLDQDMIERRLGKTDLIVGCSEYITEKIRHRFPQFADRCRTVFNGVDVNHFADNRRNIVKKNGAKRLLFIGRISPEKGVHILIDALQIVARWDPQVQLEIVGWKKQLSLEFLRSLGDDRTVPDLDSFYDGKSRFSYFSTLQQRVGSMNIADHVTFVDHVPYAQVVNYYRDADVLVNPSFSESFGRSLIEAMSCGVPVVATRVGGMAEIIEDSKTGLLVEPGDAPALAEAVLRLLADKDLRRSMGEAGRQRVIDSFSWEQITQDLVAQYKDVCQEGDEPGVHS